jgi:hypothetical protein
MFRFLCEDQRHTRRCVSQRDGGAIELRRIELRWTIRRARLIADISRRDAARHDGVGSMPVRAKMSV